MARSAERLQIRKIVTSAVDQRNPVVEFPERTTRYESVFAHARAHASAFELAAQLQGVHSTLRAYASVAPANPPAKLTGIGCVIGFDTSGMPSPAAIEQPALLGRFVQDRLAAPAARAARGVAESDLGASMFHDRITATRFARKAALAARGREPGDPSASSTRSRESGGPSTSSTRSRERGGPSTSSTRSR